MNYKRIGRALVCLVLVCCLITQTVPVKTDATGAGLAATIASASSVTVAAPLAVGASLIALGVMANNTNPLVFENVVNDAVDSLSAAGQWVADGTVELLRVVDEAGTAMYYAAGDMLESLRSWFFNEGIVSELAYSTLVSATLYGESGYFTSDVPFFVCQHSCGPYYDFAIVGSQAGTVIFYNNSDVLRYSYSLKSVSGYSDLYVSGGTMSSGVKDYGVYNLGRHSETACNPYSYHDQWLYPKLASLVGSTTTSYDLSLGQISTVPIDGTSALDWAPEYQANRLKVIEGGNDPDPDSQPPNDGKWFWPIMLPLTAATLYTMSQADEWSGQTPQEFDDYSTNTEYEILGSPEIDGYQGIELSPITSPSPDTGGDSGADSGNDSEGDSSVETTWFQKILTAIEELPSKFESWITDCKTAIEELPSKFAKWFDNLCETASNIWEWCQNLVGNLIDALANLLSSLFAPSADFIANKVNALCAKYPYLDTFLALGTDLKAYFLSLGTKPPIIYIDLGASRGSLPLGGRQAFIDLTWYAEYKATMDGVIAAFLWLWFAWRLWLSLPGLIQGFSGTYGPRNIEPEKPSDPPKFQVGSNWLNSGSSYHKAGDWHHRDKVK